MGLDSNELAFSCVFFIKLTIIRLFFLNHVSFLKNNFVLCLLVFVLCIPNKCDVWVVLILMEQIMSVALIYLAFPVVELVDVF